MKYLVLGNKGQLGREFEDTFIQKGYDFSAYDIDKVDISNYKDIKSLIESVNPGIIINCAAYNQVDAAESDYYSAMKANYTGPLNLVNISTDRKIKLLHFSTDYVYDGGKSEPYNEDDEANPLSIYAKSKYMGERAVLENSDKSLVLRVSWVFGKGRQNFIYRLLQWAGKNPELKIVTDEISVPTWTGSIVEICMKSLEQGLSGLYCSPNSASASRYDWAVKAMKILGKDIKIIPCKSEIFDLPAKRPGYSVMTNQRISETLSIEIPEWHEVLNSFLQNEII